MAVLQTPFFILFTGIPTPFSEFPGCLTVNAIKRVKEAPPFNAAAEKQGQEIKLFLKAVVVVFKSTSSPHAEAKSE